MPGWRRDLWTDVSRDPLFCVLYIRRVCKPQLPVLHRTRSRTLGSDQPQLLPAERAVFWPSYKTTDSIALEAGSPQASHRKSKSGLVSGWPFSMYWHMESEAGAL